MPDRIIRGKCRNSTSLSGLSDLAERVFWRVIVTLDDFGRYHGRLDLLLAAAFPVGAKGLTLGRFDAAVQELSKASLLRFYEHGGQWYVCAPTWAAYQRTRAKHSTFPAPPGPDQAAIDSPPPLAASSRMAKRRVPIESPEGFEAFWQAYPEDRRKGKYEAKMAWQALRLQPAQIAQVMASLEAWKASYDWLKGTPPGQFIPWPQKFLNRHRWEETPMPAKRQPRGLGDILGKEE